MSTEKITVNIVGVDKSSNVQLDTEDKLQEIRKKLEKDDTIKMDYKLFFCSIDSIKVTRDEESRRSLKEIIKNNTLYLKKREIIRVKVEGCNDRTSLVRLDTEDELQRIREILKEDENIKMDDKLFFYFIDPIKVIRDNEESRYKLKGIIKNNTLILVTEIIIRVKVSDNNKTSLVRLNIRDKLQGIREILKEDENIKMDNSYLFFNSIKSTEVTRDDEIHLIVKDIINIKNKILRLKIDTRKNIRVKVKEEKNRCSLVRLDIGNKLQRIREILEEDENIKMDNKLYFFDSTKSTDNKYVTPGDEDHIKLMDIINDNDNALCLIPKKKKDYSQFKDKLKFDFGRILTPNKIKIEISKEKLVETMKIEESPPVSRVDGKIVDFNSESEWYDKIEKFFNNKDEMMNYGPTGLSFSKYKYTKIPKITLKFCELKPTPDFIEEVKNALKLKNQSEIYENFNKIYEKFGQFIPTEVTLGGICYKKGSKVTTIGGNRQNNNEEFDKDEWIESLDKNNTWKNIEFRNPKSIFDLLDDDKLREEVYKFFGKKILHRDYILYKCRLEYGKKQKVKLSLDSIFEIINYKKADCSIFAEAVDEEGKEVDFINCLIYHPKNEKPQLIIQCFQKKQKRSNSLKLKIYFMIVGYDIHFNLKNFNNFNKTRLEVLANDRVFDKGSFPLGISVLKEELNKSIVIGHYFSKIDENKVEANVFAYNLKKKKYVEKPNFSFQVLTGATNFKMKNSIEPFTCKCRKTCIFCEIYSKKEKH